MPNETPNRIFSIYKSLGIILVVVCHSAIYTPISTFAYLFNIVVFFFVAGYFFNDQYLNNPFLFFRKKIVRLYIPWVLYGVSFVLLHNTFLKLHLIGFNYIDKVNFEPYSMADIFYKIANVLTFFKWKEPLLAPLWFLFGLFSGLSVFYSISWLSKKITTQKFELLRGVLVFLFLIIGFAGNELKLPLGIIYRPLVISGLIYLGKLYSLFSHKIKLSSVIAFVCLAILFIFTALKYKINVGGMIFGNHILFIIISCSGCYMLLTWAQLIDKKDNRLSVILNYIGNNTFSIMALHYISFKPVSVIQIYIYNYPLHFLDYYPVIPMHTFYWWIPYTIAGIGIPLLLSRIFCAAKQTLQSRFFLFL